MREIDYTPQGTCSRRIVVQVKDDVIQKVTFTGGCTGNLQAVASLAKGHKVADIIRLLEGIQCRNGTSCPDQLANALKGDRKK